MSRRHAPLLLAFLALGLALFMGLDRASLADDEEARHTVFLSISGEGANALAWYQGAPPTGVPVQDALDRFSELGYRVANIAASERPSIITIVQATGSSIRENTLSDQFYIVMLER
jgi:hypothetical protein